MIAIGGAIGTGLFLGSAQALSATGPALVISYALTAVLAYLVLRALGELVLYRPASGAFVSYMREFFGERAAYMSGWMYWLFWACAGIAELSAVSLYVQLWMPDMPRWAPVLIAVALLLLINLLSVRAFGEFEFWAAILKVGAIVIFLLVGVVLVVGGLPVGGYQAGFRNLVDNPGGFWPISDGFHWYGPLLALSSVVFAYGAIELIGVAAGEMKDPQAEVPRAIRTVTLRMAVFYVGSILLLASILPISSYTPDISPFVTIFRALGFGWIGNAMNAILIVAVLSSVNSGLYATGRILRTLGLSKQAPAFTVKMSSSGVPWAGIVATSAVYVLGALLNLLDSHAFETALSVTSIAIMFTWASIFACQLRLRSLSQAGVVARSRFEMPGSPYTSWLGLIALAVILVLLAASGWNSSPDFWRKTNFLIVIIGIPAVALIFAIGWLIVKQKVVAYTGGRMQSLWTVDGPRYRDEEDADDRGRPTGAPASSNDARAANREQHL